jgi:S1-C subfamily serine protease
MQQLITTGDAVHPYIGVYMQRITPETASTFHISQSAQGAVISRVATGSPAAAAGLWAGDVIEEIAGQPVADPQTLVSAVHRSTAGDRLVLRVLRDGRARDVTVTVAQMPPSSGG